MELLILIADIRFKPLEDLSSVDKRVELYKFITGASPTNPPKQTIGLELDHEPTKTRVVVENDRIALSVEYAAPLRSKKRLFELLSFIYKKFPYGSREIVRLGVRTEWISSWNNNFSSLVNKFKATFYRETPLTNDASDVGLPLIFNSEGFQINFSTGPMKPEQIKSFIRFKNRSLPHDAIFVDIDRFNKENTVNNGIAEIKDVISASIEYGQNKAIQTVSLIENG